MRSRKASAACALAVGAAAATLATTAVSPASAAQATSTHLTGTLADGATWIADVPANWNGTLILSSHGFGPLVAQDAFYELNGEYAIKTLLPGASGVQLRDFTSFDQGAASGTALQDAVAAAQDTAAGRARIALAAALLNETDWASGASAPAAGDYAGQEQQEEQTLTGGQLTFIVGAEASIEQAVGGDPADNVGVDYGALLRSSPHYDQIKALYQRAGLDLDADIASLNTNETYKPEGDSLHNTMVTSTNTGHLPVPELDVHTIADQLVPVQQENAYAQRVSRAGDAANLRDAYVDSIGHCDFTSADIVAAVDTVAARVQTGHWGQTDAAALNTAADELPGLGAGDFLTYRPTALVVQPSAFDHSW